MYEPWNFIGTKVPKDSFIDFGAIRDIADFERWVIAFRTDGSKDENHNIGFSLGTVDGQRVLVVQQNDSRDPNDSRRTEAKVCALPVGDYRVTMDIFIDVVPTFDTTLSQIKCESGKPPVNVKATANGGMRVQSAGNAVCDATGQRVFTRGWHTLDYTIKNSGTSLAVKVDGTAYPIDRSRVITDCACIPDAGKYYVLKIGLYEDAVPPGYKVYYKTLRVRKV